MILESVKIESFKSITSKICRFDSDMINIYIGENNVGKSTILEVISLLGKVKMPNNEYIPYNNINVEGKTIFTYMFSDDHQEIEIRQEYSYKDNKYAKGKMFVNDEPIGKSNYEEKNIANDDFEAYLSTLGVPIVFYISPNTSDAEFGEIIEKLVKMQVEITDDELNEFNSIQTNIFDNQLSNIRDDMSDVVDVVSEKINNIFNTTENNYQINIIDNEITRHKIIANISIDTKFNDLNTNLHGTGFQRALILLLIKESMNKGLIKQNILVIDEPEAFIHPTGIEILQEMIYDIDNIQTIISTHSPLMISIKDLNRNITVMRQEKDDEINVFTSSNNILSMSEKQQLKLHNIANASLFEFLFARKVILVEGDVEEMLFKSLLDDDDFSQHKGTTKIINAKGKGTMLNYLKILNDFINDYSVCFDFDNFINNTNGSPRSSSAIKAAKTTSENILNTCSTESILIGINGTVEYAICGSRVPNSRKVDNCITMLSDSTQRDQLKNLFGSLFDKHSPLDINTGIRINSEADIEDKFNDLIT